MRQSPDAVPFPGSFCDACRERVVDAAKRSHRLATKFRRRQIRADPRQQLTCRERFGQIVVGTSLHADDPCLLPGPRRQEDGWDIAQRLVRPQRLQEAEPVEARHHDVGQHEVGRMPPRGGQGSLAVSDGVDLVSLADEQTTDILAHVGIVVREQDPASDGAASQCRRPDPVVADQVHLLGSTIGQPPEGFLDIGLCLDEPDVTAPSRSDSIRRQMRGAERERHGEGTSRPFLTRDADRAAMQPHQLSHQREPDAAALKASPSCAGNAVEALEQPGQLVGRDTGAGVAHLQHRFARIRRGGEADRDDAFERELERVREQVEDDLLPHLPIDAHLLRQGRHVDVIAQAGALHGRAEGRGQIRGESGKVHRLIAGLRPPSLDARKVQKRVDELEQAQTVAMNRFDQRESALLRCQHFLERAEHQGQRRAKLVADVGEECGLCPVDLRQCVRSPPLLRHTLEHWRGWRRSGRQAGR